MKKAIVGSRVRLTGKFLRSTGQIAGGEGQKRWTVVECDCRLCQVGEGDYCAVDEPHHCQIDPVGSGYEDLAVEDRPKHRHFNITNLEVCK